MKTYIASILLLLCHFTVCEVLSSSGTCPSKEEMTKIRDSIVNSLDSFLDGKLLPLSQCGSGLWREVINLDMAEPSQQCPSGWVLLSSPRACTRPPRTSGACTDIVLPAGAPYSKVCGRILGVLNGSTDAFQTIRSGGNYVDGVTIFRSCNASEHVWTFASDQLFAGLPRCPCGGNIDPFPFPDFIGSNYFCDVQENGQVYIPASVGWFQPDAWSKQVAVVLTSPPWFSARLPEGSGNLEVSICTDEVALNENIGIQELVLYVQ